MKSIYLTQAVNSRNNDLVELLLMIKDKSIHKDEITYTLGDITGELSFKSKYDCNNMLNIGDVVSVSIKDSNIVKLNLSKSSYSLNDFMNSVKRDIKSILDELEEMTTRQFKCEEVMSLDKYFFGNKDFINVFSQAIGGLEHHTYIGGLAEHTLNVTYWARKLSYRYNCRYKEMAILAAKLHDIGKIYEYSSIGTFKPTNRGEMEGHIVIGITMIEEAFKNDHGLYSEDFKNRIKGCIVQHHGKPEYGSPKGPNTEEAFIVHYADYIDATMNKVSKVKDKTIHDTWSEYEKKIESKLFI
ncbi:HD domain-containing protein [Clostridium subterminale]|uniref:HD domain-containing protein n=1 Tax=Clostridium subterminale TaxID=1550 RepID=A0ABN1KMA2_CLOSU